MIRPFTETELAQERALRARRRPPIVWIYAVLMLVDFALGVAYDIEDGGLSVFAVISSAALSAIGLAIVWRASRTGWVVWLLLTLLFLPFAWMLAREGGIGPAMFATQGAIAVTLVSPWMLRWIWSQPSDETVTPAAPLP